MATPTFVNPPTVISLAESTTGWTGDTFSLEPDIKVQGSNSVACVQTNTGNNDIYYTGFTAADLSAVHLRLWFNIAYVGYLASSNQIQVFISDGTNTAYWVIKDPGDYAGGWKQAVVYTGDTPYSGTRPTGNSTRVGMRFVTATKPRNVPANAWFDAWYYGDGYTVTGGSSSDPITWADIAALDAVSAYNIVSRNEGVIFLSGEINIGNGATATYFEDVGDIVTFTDKLVSSTLYSLLGQGSGCEIHMSGGVLTAAGAQTYAFDMDEANLDTLEISGKQFSKASTFILKAGQDVQNCVFDGCDQIVPTTATFKFNTIRNFVGTDGAVLFPSDDSNISNLTFINCDNGVEYESGSDASSPEFVAFIFDDVSGNFDVNNTSGSGVTIILSGNSNANSYNTGGSAVTFSNPKQFKFTLSPSITGYEWRLYEVTALGSLSGAVEKDGEEDATADNQTYNYTYSSDQPIAVQVISQPDEDYVEAIQYFTLKNNDQDITILLTKDDNN